MPKENKNYLGDGHDDYGQALKQAGKAAKATGKIASHTKTTANAAAATANVGVKAGKAVANVAKGTAIGGPWGAVISAAWSMRHTVFKVIAVICLILLFAIITVASLPLLIIDRLFGGSSNDYADFNQAYNDVSYHVGSVIDEGYESAYIKAIEMIESGGYDAEKSVIIRKDYDRTEKICYVLAAYSVSVDYESQDYTDMLAKMQNVKGALFVISLTEKTEIVLIDEANMEYENVIYAECEIEFNDETVLNGFAVDLDAEYMDSGVTKGEMMKNMIKTLKIAEENGI